MKPKYQYFLKHESGNYFAVNNAGQVHITGDEIPLQTDLYNWADIQLTWQRHERYHGIFRKQSEQLKFAHDGATILKWAYITQGGVMAKVQFHIKMLNSTTLEYEPFYTGDIDFATFKSERDYTSVNVMESGISALIQAYENVEYEIPIEDSDCVRAYLDGIWIKTRYRYLATDSSGSVSAGQQQDLIALAFVRREGDFASGGGGTVTPGVTSTVPFFTCNYTTVVELAYNFKINYTNSGGLSNKLRLRVDIWTGSPGTSTNIFSDVVWTDASVLGPGLSRAVTPSGTYTKTLSEGNTIVFWVEIADSAVSTTLDYSFDETTIFINTKTNSGTAEVKAYRWPQVFNKLLTKLTGISNIAQSTFINNSSLPIAENYDALPYQTAITSEQALKQLKDSVSIKTKLSDMQQDALAGMGAGVGVQKDKVIVEKLSHFYQKDNVIIDLGDNLTDFQWEQAPNYVVNQAEVGYDGYDAVDDVNRLNCFNTKHQYKYPIFRMLDSAKRTQNMIRPYFAEPNYIELVRAQNLSNQVTINNTKRDEANRSFLLYLSDSLKTSTGAYVLERRVTVTGIEDADKAYNVALTPKRNLLRNTPLIKSILALLKDKKVIFQTAEQTKDLVSKFQGILGAISITESADVDFATVSGDPLFLPVIFRFTTSAPVALMKLMDANSYGVIRFTINGIQLDGFVLKAGLNPGKNQTYTFELLSSPANDLTKLFLIPITDSIPYYPSEGGIFGPAFGPEFA